MTENDERLQSPGQANIMKLNYFFSSTSNTEIETVPLCIFTYISDVTILKENCSTMAVTKIKTKKSLD